jgi:hypothetical protein
MDVVKFIRADREAVTIVISINMIGIVFIVISWLLFRVEVDLSPAVSSHHRFHPYYIDN